MLFSDPAIPSITRSFSGSQFPSKLTASFVEVTSVVLGLETARDRGQLSSSSVKFSPSVPVKFERFLPAVSCARGGQGRGDDQLPDAAPDPHQVDTRVEGKVNTRVECNIATGVKCNVDTRVKCKVDIRVKYNVDTCVKYNVDTRVKCNVDTCVKCNV